MRFIIIILFTIFPQIANAYVGPALGIGAIALAILLVIAILILVFSIIYYPIKYIKKKLKK